MKYFTRLRGEDAMQGPFTLDEIKARVAQKTLTSAHLATSADGKCADELRDVWQIEWFPLSKLPGIEGLAPTGELPPVVSKASLPPVQPAGAGDFVCPRCGGAARQRGPGQIAGSWGLVGASLHYAAASYICDRCGEIPASEFDKRARREIAIGRFAFFALAALLVLMWIAWLRYQKGR